MKIARVLLGGSLCFLVLHSRSVLARRRGDDDDDSDDGSDDGENELCILGSQSCGKKSYCKVAPGNSTGVCTEYCPADCIVYYDGCNLCSCVDDDNKFEVKMCTKKKCTTFGPPECRSSSSSACFELLNSTCGTCSPSARLLTNDDDDSVKSDDDDDSVKSDDSDDDDDSVKSDDSDDDDPKSCIAQCVKDNLDVFLEGNCALTPKAAVKILLPRTKRPKRSPTTRKPTAARPTKPPRGSKPTRPRRTRIPKKDDDDR